MSNAVADAVYFDTNPLVYWARGCAGSPEERDQRCASSLQALIDGSDSLACSPITLAEFTNTLWKLVRKQDIAGAAADNAFGVLMGYLANGRIRVENLRPRAFEVGMAIVGAGTREHGRAFHAWDAIHLFEACQWARTLNNGRKVVIATSDSDFASIIEVFPEFGRYVELRDLAA